MNRIPEQQGIGVRDLGLVSDQHPFPRRQTLLLILIGICATIAIWVSIVLLYGVWDMLGGR